MWTHVFNLGVPDCEAGRAMNRISFGLMLAMAVSCAAPLRAAAQCTFSGLGDLPGGIFRSHAYDISADGSVVVGDSHSEPGWQAFRWTEEEGMIGLGDLPGPYFFSRSWGVSGDGAVIVGVGNVAPSSSFEAFRWTAEDGMVGLGFLPGEGPNSQAFRASDDGAVIVGRARSDAHGIDIAFRWTEQQGMVALGVLPSGLPAHEAWGISADGSVTVGTALLSGTPPEAFRWTVAGGLEGLGFLPGGFTSGAAPLTPDGLIAYGGGTSADGPQAWRWTEEEGMVGLGAPYTPFDVSADGALVVGISFDPEEATIWDAQHGMRLLGNVLTIDYGLDLGGWFLKEAWSISANGTSIVGWGTNPKGDTEGWIARIPRMGSGDYNMDGQVGDDDVSAFQGCFAGPDVPFGFCCIFADFDDDGDVDCVDWFAFVAAWTDLGDPPDMLQCDCNPADLDCDGSVSAFDLALLLGAWGSCPDPPAGCPADLDGDGEVNAFDLAILLGSWGP